MENTQAVEQRFLDHTKEVFENYSLKDAREKFRKEVYSTKYEQKQSEKQAFKYWLTGLPTDVNILFTNHDIKELMKEVYEVSDDQIVEMFDNSNVDMTDYYFQKVTDCFFRMLQ